MSDSFIVRHKSADGNEEKSVTMSLRLDRQLQMCMALRYALDHLEFVPE